MPVIPEMLGQYRFGRGCAGLSKVRTCMRIGLSSCDELQEQLKLAIVGGT